MRCFVLAILGFCSGCTTSLAGGANGAMQSDGAATQEVAFAASAGLGDGSGALLLSAHGSIAPDVPHALHMPTHIFTRRGLWRESIDYNLRSAEAGRKMVAA